MPRTDIVADHPTGEIHRGAVSTYVDDFNKLILPAVAYTVSVGIAIRSSSILPRTEARNSLSIIPVGLSTLVTVIG